MIVGIEGNSRSGKTTFINKFIEKYPDTIRFRGAGSVNIGIQQRWQEYNFWMHNIIEQLDKLNNHDLTVMWDRFITDAVHSTDESYSTEILRATKSHKRKAIIYIDVNEHILKQRGSKEGDSLSSRRAAYLKALKSFDHLIIKPEEKDNWYITDAHIEQAANFISSVFNNNNLIQKDPY